MPRSSFGSTTPATGQTSTAPVTIINPSAPLLIAQQFLDDLYGDPRHPRLVHHRDVFLEWSNTWSEIREGVIRARIYEHLAACFRLDGQSQLVPVNPNIRLVGEVLAALKVVALIDDNIEPPAWLGGTPQPTPDDIIVFRNGLLHLPSQRLISPTPQFLALNALNIDWYANAPAPRRWLSFLRQLWPDDPESIDTLQMIFGYCLVRATELQKAFMVVGPIRSGKGTIGRVLTALVGRENIASPTLSTLGRPFGRQSLINKRLALIGDAKLGRDTDPVAVAEHILGITGEDQVTIERKNKTDWIGTLSLKIVVLCTEIPSMTDESAGIAHRFIILRLTKSFLGQEDLNLSDNLLLELPGIVRWAVRGWAKLFGPNGSGKISQPASAQAHVSEMKDAAASMKLYLDERCTFDPDYHVAKQVLYKDHCSWREAQGLKSLTQPVFGRKLRAAFPKLDYYYPNNGSSTRPPKEYRGLRLRQ